MNVTNAYSQQNIWGVLETQRAQAGNRARQASASGGDTVSISPEAQELAKAAEKGGVNECVYDWNTKQPLSAEELEATRLTLEKNRNAMDSAGSPILADVVDKLCPPGLITPHGLLIYGAIDQATGVLTRPSQESRDYADALLQTYYNVVSDMGMTYEQQVNANAEQIKAVTEEVLLRLKADERTNSLMQQLGIQVSDEAGRKLEESVTAKGLEQYALPGWWAEIVPVIFNSDIKLIDYQGKPGSSSLLFKKGGDFVTSNPHEVAEYNEILRTAWVEALKENNITDTYLDVIINPIKDAEVKNSMYQRLAENPRALELMQKFNISLHQT